MCCCVTIQTQHLQPMAYSLVWHFAARWHVHSNSRSERWVTLHSSFTCMFIVMTIGVQTCGDDKWGPDLWWWQVGPRPVVMTSGAQTCGDDKWGPDLWWWQVGPRPVVMTSGAQTCGDDKWGPDLLTFISACSYSRRRIWKHPWVLYVLAKRSWCGCIIVIAIPFCTCCPGHCCSGSAGNRASQLAVHGLWSNLTATGQNVCKQFFMQQHAKLVQLFPCIWRDGQHATG